MTMHGPLRARLAEQYAIETSGVAVGTDPTPRPQALMHSYLQFLTLRRIPAFVHDDGHAQPIDWQRERIGSMLLRWADYTPSPYTSDRPHRGQLWPWKGDIVVFDGGALNTPGTLGVYFNHEGHGQDAIWSVFTQGPDPAGIVHLPVSQLLPVGWWQLKDSRLARREERNETTTMPTITELEGSGW